MKLLLLFSIILISLTNCFAQQLPLHLNNDTTHYNNEPLYVLLSPGKQPVKLYDITSIHPTDITKLEIFKDPDSTKKYGGNLKTGLMLIYVSEQYKTTIPSYKTLIEILNVYKIKTDDKLLPVYVDSIYLKHADQKHFVLANIDTVTVETEAESGFKFIDIITHNPPRKLKKGEIWIRGAANANN